MLRLLSSAPAWVGIPQEALPALLRGHPLVRRRAVVSVCFKVKACCVICEFWLLGAWLFFSCGPEGRRHVFLLFLGEMRLRARIPGDYWFEMVQGDSQMEWVNGWMNE